ncbi:hypothetical protein RBU61_07610 [Tissierella sp. MB52-C2]|uniref:hypothetical protein n=1 Tax=Tissierella sp. MB52-C2 TaxID=3070999 RepID=UPI00280B9708|nr:hypothetical protein [Tissierella sp. MB52-C2]WMM26530.1 hypothetical protein RBU61_07610 [Tissierella sp. MB52-C2]
MQSVKQREVEFQRFPKHKTNYIKTFKRMLTERKKRELPTEWKTGQEVFEWWLGQ